MGRLEVEFEFATAICAARGTTGSSSLPPQVADAIGLVPSPNFYVAYEVDSVGSTTPQQKRLKYELTRWPTSLDPDQVTAEYEQNVPPPSYSWQKAGWRLSFEAIPRSPGRRGDPANTTIGIHPSMWVAEDSDRVLKAVRKKGRKYGDLALPFIVAVGNPRSPHLGNGKTGRYSHRTSTSDAPRPHSPWPA